MDFLSIAVEIVTKPYFFPTLALTILLVFYLLQQKKWAYLKGYSKLPPFDRGLPLVGHAIGFGKHPLQYADEMYQKYGPVYTLEVLGKRLTFLVGPEVFISFFLLTLFDFLKNNRRKSLSFLERI
jgi:hypothetical protein